MHMRLLISALPVLAGCAATISSQHDHDAMLSALRQSDGDRVVTDARVAAALSSQQLDRRALVEAVLVANRDLEAARQAWRAGVAEVSSAGALDDPMVSYEIAPLSIGSSG